MTVINHCDNQCQVVDTGRLPESMCRWDGASRPNECIAPGYQVHGVMFTHSSYDWPRHMCAGMCVARVRVEVEQNKKRKRETEK
jgi:hypothetical protein